MAERDHARRQRFGAAVIRFRIQPFKPNGRALCRAARHSRMVRVLRVAVPAAVILAMAAIVAVSIFNPFRMLLPSCRSTWETSSFPAPRSQWNRRIWPLHTRSAAL